MANNRTIRLKSYLRINVEYEAQEDITPGSFIKLDTTNANKVKNCVAADNVDVPGVMVAVEDALQGRTIDDAYKSAGTVQPASGSVALTGQDPVQCWIPTAGDEGLVRVNGNLKVGDLLMLGASGKLIKQTTGKPVVAVCLEADAAATDKMLPVRFV